MDESRDTPMPAPGDEASAENGQGMAPATALPSPRFSVPGLAAALLNPSSSPPPVVAAPSGLPGGPSMAPPPASALESLPPTGMQPPNSGIPVVSTSAGGFMGSPMTAVAAPQSDGLLVPRVPRVESSQAMAAANNGSNVSGQGQHHHHPGVVPGGADAMHQLAPPPDQSGGGAAAAGKRTSELKV